MTPAALKSWRTRLGLTQTAAAQALGVPYGTYKAWEGEDMRRQVRPAHSGLVALACAAVARGIKPIKSE